MPCPGLQNIRRHRRTLRLNRYHYLHGHGDTPGGLSGVRSMEWERKGCQYMRKKWGKLFRQGGGNAGKSKPSGRNILNSLVTVPIPGC